MYSFFGIWILLSIASQSLVVRGAIPGSPKEYFNSSIQAPPFPLGQTTRCNDGDPDNDACRPEINECYKLKEKNECFRYPTHKKYIAGHIDSLCSMLRFKVAALGPETPPEDFPFFAYNPYPPPWPKKRAENSRYLMRVEWIEGCKVPFDNTFDGEKQRIAQPRTDSDYWNCWNIVGDIEKSCHHGNYDKIPDETDYVEVHGGTAIVGWYVSLLAFPKLATSFQVAIVHLKFVYIHVA